MDESAERDRISFGRIVVEILFSSDYKVRTRNVLIARVSLAKVGRLSSSDYRLSQRDTPMDYSTRVWPRVWRQCTRSMCNV